MNHPDTRAMPPEQYDDLLEKQDWTSLSRRLTELAWRKTNKRSWEDAEDIAQTAIRRAFDPSCQRWNPKAQPNIFWFLGNMVPGIIANWRRKLRAGRVETLYDQEDLEELAPDAIDATDELMARRERARLIVDELRRRVATDRACAAVLLTYEAEIDDPAEQARASELTMQAVYNARTKLRALANEIAHTFDEGSQ